MGWRVQRQAQNFLLTCFFTLVCVFLPQKSKHITSAGSMKSAVSKTSRPPSGRINYTTTAAGRTCVTEVRGCVHQGKRFCWWLRCLQHSGSFFSKSVPRELLNSLFLCIPYVLYCCVPKALYVPTGSSWERLKLAWAMWLRDSGNSEDQSCLQRRPIWGKKFKNEGNAMRLELGYTLLPLLFAATAWLTSLPSSVISCLASCM